MSIIGTRKAFTAISILLTPLTALSQTVRDSAGVSIAENSRATWNGDQAINVALQPFVLIKTASTESVGFGDVRGVVRLSDRKIAIADAATSSLHIFDERGRLLATKTGAGDGSGQLQNLNWMRRLRGDTIAIAEGGTDVSFFSGSGEFIRRIPTRAVGTRPAPYTLLGMSKTGVGIAARNPRYAMRDVGTQWTDTVDLALTRQDGTVGEPIGRIPVTQLVQGPRAPKPVWFSATAVAAAGETRFWTGFGDHYEIRRFTEAGKLESIIRRKWIAEPITDGDWEDWVQAWARLWVTSEGEARTKEIEELRKEPWADTHPAFTQLLIDAFDRLWVRQANWRDAIASGSLSDYPLAASKWSVFGFDGIWLSDVELPAGFKPFEIGTDYVLGGQVVDGKIFVAGYSLRKPH